MKDMADVGVSQRKRIRQALEPILIKSEDAELGRIDS